jgi:hypothetical protein
MDQATQQNAALVEQMAAAASSLRSQAGELVQAVAVFTLDPLSAGQPFENQAPVRVNPAPKVGRPLTRNLTRLAAG